MKPTVLTYSVIAIAAVVVFGAEGLITGHWGGAIGGAVGAGIVSPWLKRRRHRRDLARHAERVRIQREAQLRPMRPRTDQPETGSGQGGRR
ncbi:hypothetical protein OG746_05640 [Streptomyces sp. NBC_01016]|uniref:hypothetical protein n=1 Tax=Streptomyces sp. NBC_01016 TaxID=2903720 RepID=UPI00225578E3|nr:hypothetical protein [Streptomyces sp. NBC_01016]MCX4828216.1 hypothetical protein [Streptomyces sp. NBC_01016]